MLNELFRSANLLVRHAGGHSLECCVVTFDSWTDNRSLDRSGFGEAFFSHHGVDAIHVIARENDWYQYPEMLDATAAVHAVTRHYGRVITYGSSMGAYAALRLAGMAGAHCAVAMSPQFSIDPKHTSFEYRWDSASSRFQSVWENKLPYPILAEAYVFYDPHNLDMRHIELLAAQLSFTHVRLPHAGHPVTGFLQEVGLLQSLLMSVCKGEFNPQFLMQEARRRRGQSPQYFTALADRSPPNNARRRLALRRQALKIAPGHAECLRSLAVELGNAQHFAEAIAAHEESLALEPGQPNLLWHFSYTLEKSGDLASALAIVEELDRTTEGAPIYHARLLDLRARLALTPLPPAVAPMHSQERLRDKAARFLGLQAVKRVVSR